MQLTFHAQAVVSQILKEAEFNDNKNMKEEIQRELVYLAGGKFIKSTPWRFV